MTSARALLPRAATALWYVCVAAAATAVGPGQARGQITGRVRDLTGNPVVHARVELWGDSTRLEGAVTDSTGEFALGAHGTAQRVLAFGLGTDSVWMPLGDLLHPLEIVLKARPLELPGLEAATARFRCPEKDDGAARALWERVVAGYLQIPDTESWGARVVAMRKGVTRADDFGAIGAVSYQWAQVGAGGRPPSFPESEVPLSDEWIRAHGYAAPLSSGSLDGREEAWRYLALDGTGTTHLATPVFADLQRFGFEGAAGGTAQTLVFCSKDSHKPMIRGRILLDQHDRVIRVEWRFITPEPMEVAGGQAHFSPDARYLLPESGEFWRKTPTGRYFQETERYGTWFVGDSTGLRLLMESERARATGAERRGSG